MNLPILVTGGAGYIGSHVCKALDAKGYLPVTYDNLSSGTEMAVKWGPFEYGDMLDRGRLADVFVKYQPAAVIHMAGVIAAGESVQKPYKYYENNFLGSLNLLETMQEQNCKKIIFSSTAAVYGNPENLPIAETAALKPINPYGKSKLAVEGALADFRISDAINFAILRYFNAAGADPELETGCLHEKPNNLVPILMQVQAGMRKDFELFGSDYPGPDGTAIRDYIHVSDLANAHVQALTYLMENGSSLIVNLGAGKGHSVMEVVKCVERITGMPVPVITKPRRPGDAAELVADASKAKNILGWQTELSSIESIVKTAWNWQVNGYPKYRKP